MWSAPAERSGDGALDSRWFGFREPGGVSRCVGIATALHVLKPERQLSAGH